MKALIKVGYGCNESCTFCHTRDIRHLEDTRERVDWKIERAKRLGYSMVVLSGGEPTMRPELLHWARKVASLGLDFGLVTNGLLLAYEHVTDELIERCRLRYVYMSLHGGERRVHASVVRADTFDTAMKALKNVAGRVPDLTVHCVITRANVGHLVGLVDALTPFDELVVKLSMTMPKGDGARAFDVLVPSVTEVGREVSRAIRHGQARTRDKKRFGFAHDGVPFCHLPGLEHLYDDLKTHRFATMIEADEDDFVPVDEVLKVHPEPCVDCAHRGACPGLYRGYLEQRGAGELRPTHDVARSNSYTFVPERDVPRAPGEPCPLVRDGTSPYDRGRTLFLKLRDRLRLVRTETRDFSDDELVASKEERGQLYVDVSKKLAPDDFERDLRLLVRSRECAACVRSSECTGAFELGPADAFARAEAPLVELLSGLEGDVLDVGAGEGRYAERLAPAIEAGRVRYVALDPDPARLSLLAARVPGARTLTGTLGALAGEALPPESFDAVLFLRSYNHLPSPREALAAATRALRPGGRLVLVDNVAFGLVRERAHAARAERGPGQFEHRRNDDAGRALARADGLGLALVSRLDVGPGRANQWMLVLEKPAIAPALDAERAPPQHAEAP